MSPIEFIFSMLHQRGKSIDTIRNPANYDELEFQRTIIDNLVHRYGLDIREISRMTGIKAKYVQGVVHRKPEKNAFVMSKLAGRE
jgi:hypothetical protein